ncbi:hypothetical protein ACI7RC_27360 [Brevibacillus sp. B_LB10_24]|uniref:hypothetical protein n=1 Tax=Brevibacillus sp. B_LB10_24 TaxID=3380645 RepID=UPI0038BC2AA3
MIFYGGRFSLLPINDLFYVQGNEKKISYVIKILSSQIEYRRKKYTNIIIEPLIDSNGRLVGGKIARESNAKLPMRNEGSLERVPTKLYPHVIFIIDEKEQLIFIEKNSQVFPDPFTVFKHLTRILNSELYKQGIEVDIKPLTHKGGFWSLLGELDYIYSINFKLKAPNFLGQSYKELKVILEKEKNDVNANEIEFGVSNESGSLRVSNNERYGSAVGWAEDGGGEWIVKGKSKGKGRRKKTYSNHQQLSIFEVEMEYETITVETVKTIKRLINIGSHRIKGEDDGE